MEACTPSCVDPCLCGGNITFGGESYVQRLFQGYTGIILTVVFVR
jgi:hypothetical protein